MLTCVDTPSVQYARTHPNAWMHDPLSCLRSDASTDTIGTSALCICKLLIRGSDKEWSSLLGHNRAGVFMNKGMCSGRHGHEYPITIYCFVLFCLFVYRHWKSTSSMGCISLVILKASHVFILLEYFHYFLDVGNMFFFGGGVAVIWNTTRQRASIGAHV